MGVVSAWRSVAVRVDEGLRRRPGVHRVVRPIRARPPRRTGRVVDDVSRRGRTLHGDAGPLARERYVAPVATHRLHPRVSRARRSSTVTTEYYQTLVADLGHMPGADAAALSVYYPTYFAVTGPVPMEHYTRADDLAAPEVAVMPEFVSPGFFDLFRLPRLQGRDFSWDDGPGKPAVALISASLARALFPAGDAMGKHIRLAGPDRRDVEVIGVVGDAPYGKLDDPRPFVVFRPILQDLARSQFPMAYVRASGDLATVRDGYTRVVKALGHRSLRPFMTSSEWVDQCAAAGAFHGRVGHICGGHHDPAGLHGRVRAARVLRCGAGSRNRRAPGAWRRARDSRLDDRAGRSGDRGARCAHRRSVRVGRRAARTGTTLRHRPR